MNEKNRILKISGLILTTTSSLIGINYLLLNYFPANISYRYLNKIQNLTKLFNKSTELNINSFLFSIICNNFYPKSNFNSKENNKLKQNILEKKILFNKELALPFGLSSDFDITGTKIKGLNQNLGIEFIELGPSYENFNSAMLYDQENLLSFNVAKKLFEEFFNTIKIYKYFDINNNSYLVNNKFSNENHNLYIVAKNIQKYMIKKLKNSNSFNNSLFIGINIRIRDEFINKSPYLTNEVFYNTILQAVGTTDFITVDLSNYENNYISSKLLNNTSNLFNFINNIDIGITNYYKSSCKIINENVNNNSNNHNKIKNEITRLPYTVYFKDKPKLFFKINFDEIQNIESTLNTIVDSKAVDGIIVDTSIVKKNITNNKENIIIIDSDVNKEKAMKNLQTVKLFKEKYNNNKELKFIISGGALNGKDIALFYNKGADFVLINSLIITKGILSFNKLIDEYLEEKNKLNF